MNFKSKGMQWCTFYYNGNNPVQLDKLTEKHRFALEKRIGYWRPEQRIKQEGLTILHDSSKLLVLESPDGLISQFENN